jgi:hypothetical protein
MIKLKDILSEAYAWERQEGKPLPTLAEVQAAYQAKMREDAHNEDPEEDGHEYTDDSDLPEPYDPDADDDDYMHEAEDKANKDYDGDGEVESGSEEYLGSRDKAIKAASNTKANTTAYGNYVNKARAKKAHLTDNDVRVYGIDDSGKGHELTTAAGFDKYTKFTIKSKDDDDLHEYIHADGPKNEYSDVREKEQVIESFNKRMLGNLHGHEYILREAFKRK